MASGFNGAEIRFWCYLYGGLPLHQAHIIFTLSLECGSYSGQLWGVHCDCVLSHLNHFSGHAFRH